MQHPLGPRFWRYAAAAASLLILGSCASPTPYLAAGDKSARWGYSSTKLSDEIYRIDFLGSPATPRRTVMAYALYRCAELAQELKAPAFTVLEGSLDADLLNDDRPLARDEAPGPAPAFRLSREQEPEEAFSAGAPFGPSGLQETGAGWRTDPAFVRTTAPIIRPPPMHRPPPPRDLYHHRAPLFMPYFVPYDATPPQPNRVSLLVQLHFKRSEAQTRSFLTSEVLSKLGTRIQMQNPPPPTEEPVRPTGT